MILYLVLSASLCSAAGAINIKATFLPSRNGVFPRFRFPATLPNLKELTFCSWVKVHHLEGSQLRPVISYSTTRNHNEFLVLLFNHSHKPRIRVYRGSEEVDIECEVKCQLGSWCHICVSWFGASGRVNTFVNGRRCKEEFLNFQEPYVPSGGILVIGQEQDGPDSHYDVKQAWVGDIADAQLWDEVLSEGQIREAGVCGSKRKEGNVISWLKTPMVALDGVTLSATQLCLP